MRPRPAESRTRLRETLASMDSVLGVLDRPAEVLDEEIEALILARTAARKARDLAQRTFEITQKEQTLGAGSTYQTMTAQRDLALAELDLVTAMTVYQKARIEVDRAAGSTLDHNGIQIQDALTGKVSSTTP